MSVYIISSLLAFVASFFLSGFVFLKGYRNPVRNVFVTIALLAGVWSFFPTAAFLSTSDPDRLFWVRIVYIAALFTGPAFLAFGLTVVGVQKNKFERKLILLSYMTGILFLPFLFSPLMIRDVLETGPYFSLVVGPAYAVFILFFSLLCSYSFYRMMIVFFESRGERKNQIRYVFAAYFMAFLGAVIHFGTSYGMREFFPHDIFIIVCMCLLAYAIFKHRLLDIRIAVTRAAIFTVVYTLVLGLPFGLAGLLRDEMIEVMGAQNWFWAPMILLLVLATFGPFMYIFLRRKAEDEMLKGQRQEHAVLKAAAQSITLVRDFNKLIKLIVRMLTKVLKITHASIFLLDRSINEYTFRVSRRGRKTLEGIDPGNSLIKYLQGSRKPLLFEEIKRQYEERRDVFIREIRDTMRHIDADLLVPSYIENELIGFISLGTKKSGMAYSHEDLDVLFNLANQSAFAIENAQFLKDREQMQSKIREMETLSVIRDLLGSFNHEIFNLLTQVVPTLELIGMGGYENKPEKLKDDAKKSREKLLLIKTILGWIKEYEYKSRSTEVKAFRLMDMIDDAVSFLKENIEKQNIKVELDISPSIFIIGQESLPLLFKHLAINSIYGYGMENGGVLSIQARIEEGGHKVEIVQSDTGQDLSEHINGGKTMGGKMFAEKGKIGGPSYFIAQAVTSQHNGSVDITPMSGNGTRFRIILPIDINKNADLSNV